MNLPYFNTSNAGATPSGFFFDLGAPVWGMGGWLAGWGGWGGVAGESSQSRLGKQVGGAWGEQRGVTEGPLGSLQFQASLLPLSCAS